MQISVVFSKSSADYYIFFILFPRDHWFWSTKHLADKDGRLSFGNLSDRLQRIDEAWRLRCITDNHGPRRQISRVNEFHYQW